MAVVTVRNTSYKSRLDTLQLYVSPGDEGLGFPAEVLCNIVIGQQSHSALRLHLEQQLRMGHVCVLRLQYKGCWWHALVAPGRHGLHALQDTFTAAAAANAAAGRSLADTLDPEQQLHM